MGDLCPSKSRTKLYSYTQTRLMTAYLHEFPKPRRSSTFILGVNRHAIECIRKTGLICILGGTSHIDRPLETRSTSQAVIVKVAHNSAPEKRRRTSSPYNPLKQGEGGISESDYTSGAAAGIPKLGQSQGGLWTSQWQPRALAPGCFTMLSHWRIQWLLGSQSDLSMLGYLTRPRWAHLCPLATITPLSFIFFFFCYHSMMGLSTATLLTRLFSYFARAFAALFSSGCAERVSFGFFTECRYSVDLFHRQNFEASTFDVNYQITYHSVSISTYHLGIDSHCIRSFCLLIVYVSQISSFFLCIQCIIHQLRICSAVLLTLEQV